MTKLEFFFDCSSPWTYLAFTNIQPLAAEFGVDIIWRPILVGGVFNAINDSVYKARENPIPAKARYGSKDMADWARMADIHITYPPSIFPVNSVKAMRGCFVAETQGKLVPFATAVFEAYWGDNRDIGDEAVLVDICKSVGMDADAFFEGIAEQSVKDSLKNTTQELMDRGGFGSPTIYINETDMYFGNDRMVLVLDALARL
jgi:2-hydroxychromene-2-carboxylate isomerase